MNFFNIMDRRLDSFRNSIINGWFPNDLTLFTREDAPDIPGLVELLIADALEMYRTKFPALSGRIYTDFMISSVGDSNKLLINDIDNRLLKFLCLYDQSAQVDPLGYSLARITGRQTVNQGVIDDNLYLGEQAALELYTRLIVDEWSSRTDNPVILSTDDDEEYILPNRHRSKV